MQLFHGTLMHSPVAGRLEVLADRAVLVDETGVISEVSHGGDAELVASSNGIPSARVQALTSHQFLLPGTGTDLALFEWLQRHALPAEQAFRDLAHAGATYAHAVRRLLACGTTTAALFATLDAAPCKALADVVEQQGLRAVLGKVSIDHGAPDSYSESTAAGLEGAESVIQYIQAKPGALASRRLLLPAVVPRFAPMCSRELLAGLGHLASMHDAHVHSHISESRDEVAFSRRMHLYAAHDAEVFERAGLLRRGRTILAHGTQLRPGEVGLLAQAGAAVAHCPLSNFFFGDGLLDVRGVTAQGLQVGLGTDMAGGYSPSMLQAMRMAVINSHALKAAALRHTSTTVPDAEAMHVLTYKDALHMATMGGAEALGLSNTIGSFAEGKAWDALVVDAGSGQGFDVFEGDSSLQLLEKVINCGDDRHIAQVYVQGRRCK